MRGLGIACANNKGGIAKCAAIHRQIHRRLRWPRQAVSGIAHDADGLVTPQAEADQVLLDRVLMWKILPRELSADVGFVGADKTLIGTEVRPRRTRLTRNSLNQRNGRSQVASAPDYIRHYSKSAKTISVRLHRHESTHRTYEMAETAHLGELG